MLDKRVNAPRKLATEFIDVFGHGVVIFGFRSQLRGVERNEFAQGAGEAGERARRALGRHGILAVERFQNFIDRFDLAIDHGLDAGGELFAGTAVAGVVVTGIFFAGIGHVFSSRACAKPGRNRAANALSAAGVCLKSQMWSVGET
jgi:hypothetical protein